MREKRVWRILSCFVNTLRNAVFIVWMMAGIAERKTARGDEGLEGAEGNGDNFGIFRWAGHEDGAREDFLAPGSGSDLGKVVSMRPEGVLMRFQVVLSYVRVGMPCVLCVPGAGAGAKRRRAKPVDPAGEVSCAGG
jgi:hypothetical protein